MYNPDQVKALFDIFKSGSLENVELAIQLSQSSTVDLCLPHFEELFDYLVDIKAINLNSNHSIAQKVHTILTLESLQLKIETADFSIIPGSIFFIKKSKKTCYCCRS